MDNTVYMQDRKLLVKLQRIYDSHWNYKNYLTNMYKFKVNHKNTAVDKEILSTIESIYT